MKNKISRKEIQGKISDSVKQVISQLEVKDTSKKVKKIIKRASKRIANKVSRQLNSSAIKTKKDKLPKTAKVKGNKKEKIEVTS